MALIEQLPIADAGAAAARALEQLLGHGVVFTPADPAFATPTSRSFPEGETRSIALPFGNGIAGEVTLVVTLALATTMEAATPDASLVSAALVPLQAAAAPIEPVIHLQAEPDFAGEIATDTLLAGIPGDFAVVPLLESDEYSACVVVRIVEDESVITPPPPPAPAPPTAQDVPNAMPGAAPSAPAAGPGAHAGVPGATIAVPAPPPTTGNGEVVRYEFQPLGDGHVPTGPMRPMALLNDVTMEVTAELGRRRMKVRDLVALEVGSVIELDKTAGSPVDILVNGALLAHGEVVVIDEDFGIRVSDIVVGDN